MTWLPVAPPEKPTAVKENVPLAAVAESVEIVRVPFPPVATLADHVGPRPIPTAPVANVEANGNVPTLAGVTARPRLRIGFEPSAPPMLKIPLLKDAVSIAMAVHDVPSILALIVPWSGVIGVPATVVGLVAAVLDPEQPIPAMARANAVTPHNRTSGRMT
jgi:hypothetical protein